MRKLLFILSSVLVSLSCLAKTEKCDVCVYGGTAGGVMAAIQSSRMGCKVILVSESAHVGGMATSGLTATDINKHLAVGGLAEEFYREIYSHYMNEFAWRNQTRDEFMESTKKRTFSGKNDERKMQWVYESSVGEEIMRRMLADAGVRVIYRQRIDSPASVIKRGARISSLKFSDLLSVRATVFIDASYEGDLAAFAGVNCVIGREGTDKYGESLAGIRSHQLLAVSPFKADGSLVTGVLPEQGYGSLGSADMRTQAYCYRVCLTDDPENMIPFSKPSNYRAEDHELLLRRILSGEKKELKDIITFTPMPNRKTDTNHLDYIGASQNYPFGNWAQRDSIALEHRRYAESLLWFLGHDPRVPEVMRNEMNRWGWAADEFTDNGNFPNQLYVRECRRIVGKYVMTQQDVQGVRSEAAASAIGLGSYALDCHFVNYLATTDGVRIEGGMFVGTKPYPVPYGAILPKEDECSNLLVPVCMSASHVAYSSLRMEPVYMVLGQSAAIAAVLSLRERCIPQEIPYEKLRESLLENGQILEYGK